MSRFRVIVAEAIRSLGANLSTTFAATTTVLIGMFMLGLVVGLGSWALSLSDHYKKQLLVNVYFCTQLRCGTEASNGEIDNVRTLLDRDAAGEERPLRLQGRGARDREEEAP